MSNPINLFSIDVERVLESLKEAKEALIIYSDDGDGVASAYLFTRILDQLNIEYRLISLDKAFPEAIEEIYSSYFDIYIFLDIGGAFYHYIPEKLHDKTVIIDHHLSGIKYPSPIIYINPHKYGFKEDETPSSSIMVYYILKKISREAPREAWAGLIGYGESPYVIKGINWRVAYEGILFGNIKRSGKSLSIYINGFKREYRNLYREITLISSAGYYEDLPIDIIAMFRYKDFKFRDYIEHYKAIRQQAYNEMTSILEEGMFVKENIQWFEDYKNLFYNMGTRIFDSYVSYVSHQARLYDKDKYILGISVRRPYIPGIGVLKRKWLNIAVRTSKKLEFRIIHGYSQPVSALVEAASYSVGGLGYGYQANGSCIIPYESKDEFINIFNELAGGE